jgi:hypothetical protein
LTVCSFVYVDKYALHILPSSVTSCKYVGRLTGCVQVCVSLCVCLCLCPPSISLPFLFFPPSSLPFSLPPSLSLFPYISLYLLLLLSLPHLLPLLSSSLLLFSSTPLLPSSTLPHPSSWSLGIVQGGLDTTPGGLREQCVKDMVERNLPG